MDKLNILVVDDKKIVGDFFNFVLGYKGHAIKVAHTALEAVSAAQQENFDIAFLDIIIPEEDGIKVLEDMKAVSPQLPVVMMSGFSVEEKRQRAKELGALMCLKKPLEVEDIYKVIKEATGKEV